MKFLINLIVVVLLIIYSPSVQANPVHAVGQGVTEQSALHSAMRHAIEKQLGVLIDSKILVQNKQLIILEIL